MGQNVIRFLRMAQTRSGAFEPSVVDRLLTNGYRQVMSDVIEVEGHGGTLTTFDGRTITILRKGFLARTTVGKGEKQIPLAHLTAVQFKPAGRLINGFIQFTVGGGIEPRSSFGHQTMDAVTDENSVVFTHAQSKAFEDLRDAVQAALVEYHHSTRLPQTPAPDAIPEQIKQLADLRDSGALTDAEFEAKKAELLGRM